MVLLVLSLNGVASALTFKSDGTVIQNDGGSPSPKDSVAAKAAKKARLKRKRRKLNDFE